MTRFWKTYGLWIKDAHLHSVFRGTSPLSRRTIGKRLGDVPQRVLRAILFSAEQRGNLVRAHPCEVGSNKHKLHIYKSTYKLSAADRAREKAVYEKAKQAHCVRTYTCDE